MVRIVRGNGRGPIRLIGISFFVDICTEHLTTQGNKLKVSLRPCFEFLKFTTQAKKLLIPHVFTFLVLI